MDPMGFHHALVAFGTSREVSSDESSTQVKDNVRSPFADDTALLPYPPCRDARAMLIERGRGAPCLSCHISSLDGPKSSSNAISVISPLSPSSLSASPSFARGGWRCYFTLVEFRLRCPLAQSSVVTFAGESYKAVRYKIAKVNQSVIWRREFLPVKSAYG